MQPPQFVYKIEFLKIDFELKEYFFKYHTTDIPNLRYLIGIPTVKQEQIDEILNSVAKTKIDLTNEHYKLFDGTINGKEARAINCVNGFYLSNNIVGVVRNPKPQLAAWSFLTFAIGPELRDKVLANTGIKDDFEKEDNLKPVEPTRRSFKR